MLLKSFGDQQQTTTTDHHQTSQKLEEFLARLEEERLKIDAFKRELPLCMQLLTNAMEASRQQLQSYRANNEGGTTRPVLEEFIPLKNSSSSCDNNGGAEKMAAANMASDKANWMTSAQLWSDQGNEGGKKQQPNKIIIVNNPPSNKANNNNHSGGDASSMSQPDGQTTSATAAGAATQPQRKARRCWSPDLHRRFVNALQMLGGSQVATPKQIRELMKVDGLTNDEVKSHLQKYRLHTRRPIPGPQTAATGAPQLVVLGGIWVPPDSPVSGDRSESIEDGKSSASGGSWKGDSGSENGGGERKVLVLREEGEVGNNGTEISLKF
nr:myb family transcription factor EFM [Ipomoea batatas]